MDKPVKFFVALRGDKSPKEYIRIAKMIEDLGYDRIYVYDDLMFHSSTQILALIAEHTNKIEIGPCLVNGFYRHPAIIAQEAAFLEELAPNRSVLGIGRGAFFDFYNMLDTEQYTRQGVLETTQQVNRLLSGDKSILDGELFHATNKAFLRIDKPQKKIPTIIGSWNLKIADIAGNNADEMQVAEVWDEGYLNELKTAFNPSKSANKRYNIGGMTCISDNKEKASEIAKSTAAVYIPYLNVLMEKYGYNTNEDIFQKIFSYSRNGEYEKCASLISNEIIQRVALVGTPEEIASRLINIHNKIDIDGVMISPPYGIGTMEENLELIMERVINKVNSKVPVPI